MMDQHEMVFIGGMFIVLAFGLAWALIWLYDLRRVQIGEVREGLEFIFLPEVSDICASSPMGFVEGTWEYLLRDRRGWLNGLRIRVYPLDPTKKSSAVFIKIWRIFSPPLVVIYYPDKGTVCMEGGRRKVPAADSLAAAEVGRHVCSLCGISQVSNMVNRRA